MWQRDCCVCIATELRQNYLWRAMQRCTCSWSWRFTSWQWWFVSLEKLICPNYTFYKYHWNNNWNYVGRFHLNCVYTSQRNLIFVNIHLRLLLNIRFFVKVELPILCKYYFYCLHVIRKMQHAYYFRVSRVMRRMLILCSCGPWGSRFNN